MGGELAKKSKKSAAALIDTRRPVGELNLSLVKLAGYTAFALSCLNSAAMSLVE
jgi:hypothetical protein